MGTLRKLKKLTFFIFLSILVLTGCGNNTDKPVDNNTTETNTTGGVKDNNSTETNNTVVVDNNSTETNNTVVADNNSTETNNTVAVDNNSTETNNTVVLDNNLTETNITGKVIDGEISGATLFLDLNLNNELDNNEPSTKTKKDGSFLLILTHSHQKHQNYLNQTAPLVAFGGKDIRTNESFEDYLMSMTEGKIHVNVTPFTTLIAQSVIEELSNRLKGLVKKTTKKNLNDIKNKIDKIKDNLAELFGISKELLTKDPIALAKSGNNKLLNTSLQMHKASKAMKKAMKKEVRGLKKSILSSYRALGKELKKLNKDALKSGDNILSKALESAMDDSSLFDSSLVEKVKKETKTLIKEIDTFWKERDGKVLDDEALNNVIKDSENNIDTNNTATDTIKPVITLLGDATVTIEKDTTYNDAGATANDNIDGDISSNIQINNSVNTNTSGTYSITYNVSDSAKNQAIEITRTVIVTIPATPPPTLPPAIDSTKPVITLLGDSTVNIIKDTNYSDAGATASDNKDGNITSNIVINNPVDTALIGTYLITYDVNDSSGNSAVQVTRTLNVFTPTPPVIIVPTLTTIDKNISAYLQKMQFGEENDNLWKIENNNSIKTVQSIVEKILNQHYLEAQSQAKTINGNLFKLVDSNKTYYLLHLGLEQLNDGSYYSRGGTYVFYPQGENSAIQVPHPQFDTNTNLEGIESYLALESKYLLIAGTHRKSSTNVSHCQSSFQESDSAHNNKHFFFGVHQKLSDSNPQLLFIELHGFGATTQETLWQQCDERNNSNLINISEGISDNQELNISSFMHLFHQEINRNSTIKSCIYSPQKDINSSDIYSSMLGGTLNISGRYTNGSNSVCSEASSRSSHRFIHLEQSFNIRNNERNTIINALKVAQQTFRDVTAPKKPILISPQNNTTNQNSIIIKIKGEVNTHVIINNRTVGLLDSNGILSLELNTSGEEGEHVFTIQLSDTMGNISEILTLNIIKISLSKKKASNFLNRTTFGATKELIEEVQRKGISTWLDEQLALPYEENNHLRRTIQLAKKMASTDHPESVNSYIKDNDTIFNKSIATFESAKYQMSAWFQTVLFDKNQLRHRVAYALSQIIVESQAEPIFKARGEALAVYFDILSKNALGNYKELLIEISHSASMGLYLTYNGNKKEEEKENTIIYPDENYAREIMQLFTIGLSELNLDGTKKTDAIGNSIPSYTQNDVNGLAKVFTGWDIQRNSRFGRVAPKAGDLTHPLEFTAEYHDFGTKTILGKTIPAGNDGAPDMQQAIDILMAHTNVAPFISKQLIMRLVKSNPTPAYISRVATIFNDNGQGVKGDLKAVVRAILLDPELKESTGVKKFKEPLLAYTEFLRAFKIENLPIWKTPKTIDTVHNAIYIQDPTNYLRQGASRAFTVFNFYNNDYIPNDSTFKQEGLKSPELQIQTDSMLIDFSNKIRTDLIKREKRYLLKLYGTVNDVSLLSSKSNIFYNKNEDKFLLDCKDEYDAMEKELENNINGTFKSFNNINRSNDTTADSNGITNRDRAIKALIVEVDNKLLLGTLSLEKKNLLFQAYKDNLYSTKMIRSDDPTNKIYQEIIVPIIVAIVTSEDFMVQE